MLEYLHLVRNIQERFEGFDLSHVPRSGNTHADSLATLATSSAQDLPRVILVEDLYVRALAHQDAPRIHQVALGPSWMDAISLFLEKDLLPVEKSFRLNFSATNNEAEYEALLQGMQMVQKLGGKAVRAFSDSRLVVG